MLYLNHYDKDGNYLEANIRGAAFSEFLEVCLEHSDFFTLTDHMYSRLRAELMSALLPYCFGAIKTPKWFGYDYTMVSYNADYSEMMVYFFKSAPEARDLITRFVDDVFFGHDEPTEYISDDPRDYPIKRQNLEDILFFKDGRMIIYSICHESMLMSYSEDEDFISKLRKLGEWSECETSQEDEEWIQLENTMPGIDKLIDFSRIK